MAQLDLAISPETFKQNAQKWLRIVRFNESGIVLNFVGDHIYTVPTLLKDKKLLKELLGKSYPAYILFYHELSPSSTIEDIKKSLIHAAKVKKLEVSSSHTIEKIIDQLIREGYEVAFFISRIEHHFVNKSELISRVDYLARNHRVSVLYFSEQNLTNPSFVDHQREFRSVFQNVLYQEVYGRQDAEVFVTQNEKLWGIVLPQKIKEEIIKTCGGSLWLLRQAVRSFRNDPSVTPEALFSAHEVRSKAFSTWNQLFPNEQEVIRELIINQKTSVSDAMAFEFLLRAGLLSKTPIGFSLTIPLIVEAASTSFENKGLYREDGEIYWNEKNLTPLLTKKEYTLLEFFLKHKKTVICREDLGQALWKEKDFSVFALEKLISKLRKKLIHLGMPQNSIKAQKGVGYVFSG